ncbi:39S ribosomal protein L18, mitochondrial [Hyalella azteca]|uniref:Large ribosomal subunit protein uL18m n=1 Tax=Hyalella azteca TaxID=294128 RepID=A0A8B7P4J5_HYAAZ|nr:39S ribosomal protein L18, mitochondrial [Hyalella azteca]XP_047741271.1 39S ribosomal protein L18, mitochondrial [Hyalella azteca]
MLIMSRSSSIQCSLKSLQCLLKHSNINQTSSKCISQSSYHFQKADKPDDSNHKPGSKDDILSDYVNRNPRNLEMLRIARQPQGYDLDVKQLYYWNRLELQQVGRFLIGRVRHESGRVILQASTREWPMQSRLPSTQDYTAAVTLARVLARRCLEAGYSEMAVDASLEVESSTKAAAFVKTIEECGVRLSEDFQLHETDMYPWALERPTLPWDVPEHIADQQQ